MYVSTFYNCKATSIKMNYTWVYLVLSLNSPVRLRHFALLCWQFIWWSIFEGQNLYYAHILAHGRLNLSGDSASPKDDILITWSVLRCYLGLDVLLTLFIYGDSSVHAVNHTWKMYDLIYITLPLQAPQLPSSAFSPTHASFCPASPHWWVDMTSTCTRIRVITCFNAGMYPSPPPSLMTGVPHHSNPAFRPPPHLQPREMPPLRPFMPYYYPPAPPP